MADETDEENGRRPRRIAVALLLSCGISACAVLQPLSVPLVYKSDPKQQNAKLGSLSCHRLSLVQVSGARSEKTLGTRVHDNFPLRVIDVTVPNDAASWVRDGVQGYLIKSGINVEGSGPRLNISLDSLRTTEQVHRISRHEYNMRSSYEARIALTARLQTASGRTCWEDRTEGATKGAYYGRHSGDIIVYQETLNGALDAAASNMAGSSGFENALCHCAD